MNAIGLTSDPRLRRSAFAVLAGGIALATVRFGPDYWTAALAKDTMVWGLATLAAAILARVALRERAVAGLLCGAAAYFAIGLGLDEVASAALFFASARWLGAGALSLSGARSGREFEFSRPLIVGIALYLGLFGALIHAPINSQALYLTILLAPLVIAVALRRGRESFVAALGSFADAEATLARLPYGRFVVGLALIGFVARFAFFPSAGSDDNILHLRLWTELSFLHRDAFAIGDEVWAATPFGFDLIHAIISLAAGADARGALDLAILALVIRQIWRLCAAFRVAEADRLLAVILFVSTPLVALLMTTLQPELFLVWLSVLGARILVERSDNFEIGDFLSLGAVAAICVATKLPAAALGGALFAVALGLACTARGRSEISRQLGRWPLVLVVFAIYAFVAFHAYWVAYKLSGNPFLPLFNAKFCSRFFACVNFSDARWQHGFNLSSYLGLFFHTHRFQEARNYTAGFQYLLLLPFGVFVMFWRRGPWERAAILAPLLLYGVAMFSQTNYLRYLFPVAGLGSVAIAALIAQGGGSAMRGVVRTAMAVCVVFNLLFLPGVYWMFANAPDSTYSPKLRERLTENLSTGKALTFKINQLGARPRVLYLNGSDAGATLFGQPLYISWYAPARNMKYRGLKNDSDAAAFLTSEAVDLAIFSPSTASAPTDLLMADYLTRFGEPMLGSSPFEVVRVRDAPVAYVRAFELGAQAPVQADDTPRVISTVKIDGGAIGRYSVRFVCANASGNFIAQVNWNVGPPYYRIVSCAAGERAMTDVFTIPPGARTGEIYVTAHAAGGASVTSLTLETD